MEKVGEDYVYKGELGVTTVLWELYDISWNKVLQFSKEEAKIMAPIRFIWFKEAGKEMKTMNYVYDENPDDMFLVICLGKQANIKPVNGEKFWKKTNKPAIAIPEFRKPRGRPKTRDRRKEPFEDLQNQGKSTRHGRIQHCSRCKQAGHIKTGCKNEPVTEEGPKNRRGRPRKHPIQVR